jgi:hypothetical protein
MFNNLENQMLNEAMAADKATTNTLVVPEQIATESPTPLVGTVPIAETPVVETKPVEQSTSPQESWKYMREELERAREERAEAIRYAKDLEKAQREPKQPKERYGKLREDEFPEAKHFNSQQEELEEEKQRREASEQRMYNMIVENRLMTEHPDLKAVLTPDNIAKLTKLEPELAASIAANPDPYTQHKAALKAIKTYVMAENKNEARELEIKAQNAKMVNNLTKPMPTTSALNTPSASPINTANAFAGGLLTQERKEEIWKEYVQAAGNKYLNFK